MPQGCGRRAAVFYSAVSWAMPAGKSLEPEGRRARSSHGGRGDDRPLPTRNEFKFGLDLILVGIGRVLQGA